MANKKDPPPPLMALNYIYEAGLPFVLYFKQILILDLIFKDTQRHPFLQILYDSQHICPGPRSDIQVDQPAGLPVYSSQGQAFIGLEKHVHEDDLFPGNLNGYPAGLLTGSIIQVKSSPFLLDKKVSLLL